ncbi:MAG: exodeoxyribonuclease III [Luminiphilus sp.]|nr:exodeoxyribonuclease III [Luminiphilus sp.]
MRIITCNTNGIRAAERKGFFPWLAEQDADVVCIQETKAQIHQLDPDLFLPEGYACFYNDAERPGYSGTALFSRVKPLRITTKLGWEPMDSQGRYLQADFKDLSVISLYVPSGSSGDEAQARKEIFMTQFFTHLQSLRRKRREFVICADWNICHREIDLKNWRANRKNSGFLPHERAWLDRVFDELGWVDVFRRVNPHEDQYTWWSNRGQAWAKNVGWRLDYMLCTPGVAEQVKSASIYRDQRFSDHAPLTMDFARQLQA